MNDITVLIPFKNGGNEDWLKESIGSLPVGIRYMVLRNDGELAEALNAGLAATETEYVYRLDADDIIHPKTLDFLHSLIWDVDVAYPSLVYMLENSIPIREGVKAAQFCPNRLLQENYIPSQALIRTQALRDVGGWRDLEILEDWDLWVRMSRAGKRFKSVHEAKVFYRQHDGQRNKVPSGTVDEVKRRMWEEIVGEHPFFPAAFYYQASYATTYVRILLPSRYLPGPASQTPALKMETEDSLQFPDHPPAAVWQFPGDTARAIMMAAQQEQGIKVFVEVDDNYLSTAMVGASWGKKHKDAEHTLEAHRKIAEWADGILVSTEELAKKYRKVNENVHVCPNQVDPTDWPEPEESDGVLRIGWFGSHSHYADIGLVSRALEWAAGQPNVEVVTMGVDPKWKFPRVHYPWTNDHSVVRKLIGTVDVGLAPVVPDPWSVCRSDLKALEYGMGGAFPLLSDLPPYEGYDGPCEKLATAKEFYHAVKHFVSNPDEARALGQETRKYVLEHRTIQGNVHPWKDALTGVRV